MKVLYMRSTLRQVPKRQLTAICKTWKVLRFLDGTFGTQAVPPIKIAAFVAFHVPLHVLPCPGAVFTQPAKEGVSQMGSGVLHERLSIGADEVTGILQTPEAPDAFGDQEIGPLAPLDCLDLNSQVIAVAVHQKLGPALKVLEAVFTQFIAQNLIEAAVLSGRDIILECSGCCQRCH